ncbi:MAG: DUF5011 domain-containing protein, partial [Gammaproteobacteria bacterium]|nr:DUF5011 domain-containing protein [Gammaproteobacteria bacterium]
TAAAVTLLIDQTAPQITPPLNHILEATGVISTLTLTPPTVLDTSPVTLSHNGLNAYPLGVTSITWTAVDVVGNRATTIETVTVVDTQGPLMGLNGNANVTLKISTPYQELGVTAVDLVDGDVGASVQVSGMVDPFTLGSYTLRYDAQDSRGNASFVLRTVQVVPLHVPVITLNGGDVSLEAGDSYQDAGATAQDDLGNDLSANVVVSSTVNTYVPGVYSVLYQVSDQFGNSAQLSRVVTVLDRTPASLALLGNANVTIEAGEFYQEAGVIATDIVDGDLSAAVHISGQVNSALPGTYQLNYRVRDVAGNLSVPVQRTVRVQDTTVPVLMLPSDVIVVTETLLTAVDFGQATANDLFSVSLSHDAPSRFPLGETLVTWVASDFYGNQSQAQQKVTLLDLTAPRLTLLGEASLSILQGELYQEPGFEALDQVEGDLSAQVQVSGQVESEVAGIYTLRYAVSDSSGNAAPELIRTIWVISILDSDGDGILNEFDLDDDNDGLSDQVEGLLDSDGDGVPDYLDLDSDNDGLPDLLEALGVDEGNDGLWDQFVDLDGDGLSDGLLLMPLKPMDTDNDGLPDYLDNDSDNDTLMDIIEAGGMDYDNDGRVDQFIDQNGDGWSDQFSDRPLPLLDSNRNEITDQLDNEIKFSLSTSVTGVGSAEPFWLLMLFSLLILRRKKLAALSFLPMLAFSPVSYSRTSTAVDANLEPLPNPTWSLNVLTGISRLQPSRTQFGVDITDNRAMSLGLAVGFQWHKEWLLEGFALDLGEVRLKHRLAQIGDLGSLAYKAYGLSLEYLIQLPKKKLRPYLKGGLHMLSTEATDSRIALRNLNDIGIHWGAGFLWPINSQWGAKLDYSHFDRDAQVLALAFQARWGRSSSVVKTASLPTPVGVQRQAVDVKEKPAQVEPLLIQLRIGFAYDQSILSEAGQTVLHNLALQLMQHDEVVLLLAGHTDSRGSRDYNMQLSLERANAVRDYLLQHGVSGHRLQVTGYGERHPLRNNATLAGRVENRRVEIRTLLP